MSKKYELQISQVVESRGDAIVYLAGVIDDLTNTDWDSGLGWDLEDLGQEDEIR
jgi:hypothetical protein